jgi:hypothetical protein
VGGCGTWPRDEVEGLEWITHGERAPHHIIFSFLRFSQEGGANPLGG